MFKYSSRTLCMQIALVAVVAVGGTLATAGSASAQGYGSSFYYHNPRTGFTYSQGVGVGNRAAYGGFSYSQGGRTHSAGSGYYGRNHYQHQYHATPRYTYGQTSYFGNGYYPRQSSGNRRRY